MLRPEARASRPPHALSFHAVYFRGSDGVMLVFDVTSQSSFDSECPRVDSRRAHLCERGARMCVCRWFTRGWCAGCRGWMQSIEANVDRSGVQKILARRAACQTTPPFHWPQLRPPRAADAYVVGCVHPRALAGGQQMRPGSRDQVRAHCHTIILANGRGAVASVRICLSRCNAPAHACRLSGVQCARAHALPCLCSVARR